MTLAKSPARNTFHQERYLERQWAKGELPSEEYLEMFKTMAQQREERELDQEWQKNNLEYDLRSTNWILEKVRTNNTYAQNLYAALCNNEFQELDVFPILANKTWSCSWRYAGGIIADMQEKGDYIDWYCSGIRSEVTDQAYMDLTQEEKAHYDTVRDYVGEGMVTEEIESDLKKLGWQVIESDE